MEDAMTRTPDRSPATLAVLAMADIRAITETFECGECNVFDALADVCAVIETYTDATHSLRRAA